MHPTRTLEYTKRNYYFIEKPQINNLIVNTLYCKHNPSFNGSLILFGFGAVQQLKFLLFTYIDKSTLKYGTKDNDLDLQLLNIFNWEIKYHFRHNKKKLGSVPDFKKNLLPAHVFISVLKIMSYVQVN